MSRVQLALNVTDIDEAVSFYARRSGADHAVRVADRTVHATRRDPVLGRGDPARPGRECDRPDWIGDAQAAPFSGRRLLPHA